MKTNAVTMDTENMTINDEPSNTINGPVTAVELVFIPSPKPYLFETLETDCDDTI